MKFITSQDTVTARNLYGHLFDFFPSHKTFVTTNHKPIIRGTDEGIWRRVQLIPFTVRIDKSKLEKDFRERRLLPELSGILNWALEGLAAYQTVGLSPPQAVLASTDGYREDMDVVGQWITPRCAIDAASTLATAAALPIILPGRTKRSAGHLASSPYGGTPFRPRFRSGQGRSWSKAYLRTESEERRRPIGGGVRCRPGERLCCSRPAG